MAVLNGLMYNGNSYPLGSGGVEKLAAPTNLTVVAGEVSAIISWTDPYNGSTVRWVSTKIVRSTSGIPTSVSDGTVVATITTKNQYSVSGYTDRVLTAGTTYYYNVFAIGDNGTESGGAGASVVPLVEKIKAPTNIIAIAGNESATITWTDPNDGYSTIWSRSILVRNASRVPMSSSDGTVLVTETTRNQYSSVGYTDTGLTPGETYYYNVFAVGDNSIETGGTGTSVVPVVAYTIDFLLVGGGGGGGGTDNRLRPGGGGGAGGLIYCCGYEILQGATIPVTIGAGGTSTGYNTATKGGDSCFGSIVAYGGGPGQSYYGNYETCGGSGGGGDGARPGTGGECVDGQGHAGGNGASRGGGGGGGAGAAGCNAPGDGRSGGAGGAGLCFDISGQLCRYAGGGGGGNCTSGCGGAGGQGGGQKGGCGNATYYGGGGGGGGYCNTRNGAGYQGIFIARYPTECGYGITGGTRYTCGNYTIHCFTSDGSLGSIGPGPITVPGIFHNPTLGLISLSSDGNNWVTISDKNLGATVVYNDGDTLSESNAGKYYQWGNNYGFPFTGATTLSSTQVDAGNYGPGNYYDNSTYITHYSGCWDSSNNGNLWGYTTGTLEAMQGPSAEGYHIPTSIEWENIINLGQTIGAWGSNGGSDLSKLLKMPFAGQINTSGNLTSQGTVGFYHSSRSLSNENVNLQFQTSQLLIVQMKHERGQPIRSFKNIPVQPDGSWRILYM